MADGRRPDSFNKATPDEPPPAPVPASDPGLMATAATAEATAGAQRPLASMTTDMHDAPSPRLALLADDIFDISPLAALQLLGAGVEALVRITGDIPPTPPSADQHKATPTHMRGLDAEKKSIVRSLSERSLTQLAAAAAAQEKEAGTSRDESINRSRMPPTPPPTIDGVHLRKASPTTAATTDIASSAPALYEPYIVIGANSQPLNVQHSAITRKFYSKRAPPISISEYLLRLHRFCPMSTAVYLATSLYIHRLAVADKAIAVTRRNAHRLLLAGLRVAMKALEDLTYPHAKVAKVGGVSETELARLEINFCFLAGFELAVRADEMQRHLVLMKSGRALGALDQDPTAAAAASAAACMVNGTLPLIKRNTAGLATSPSPAARLVMEIEGA